MIKKFSKRISEVPIALMGGERTSRSLLGCGVKPTCRKAKPVQHLSFKSGRIDKQTNKHLTFYIMYKGHYIYVAYIVRTPNAINIIY